VGQIANRSTARSDPFGDRLADRVAERESQIVLGLDPDPARLWPDALDLADAGTAPAGGRAPGVRSPGGRGHAGAGNSPAEMAGRAVAAHCRLLLEAAGAECVAVKPQVACFERLGAPGWAALAEVVRDAHDRGLIVIADAKRGDIDISAKAYGQAFLGSTPTPFGDVPGLGADMLTVNPLLGRDSLEPLVDAAREQGAGLLVLTRTSNPGAADIQDRELSSGEAVSDAIAQLVDDLGRPAIGRSGLSDIGAVTGATAPEHLERLRSEMPAAVMLLPGMGPQGASGRDLAPAFVPGRAGGLVAASRAIVYAYERDGAEPAAAARREARRLRELIWDLYA
jgi:orotidine-5'-phosphate decarboxylase